MNATDRLRAGVPVVQIVDMLAYFAIFACAVSGYAGAPPWTIAAAAIALAAVSYAENTDIYERGRELGLARVLNMTLLRSLLNGLIAATVAFAAGWAFKWL